MNRDDQIKSIVRQNKLRCGESAFPATVNNDITFNVADQEIVKLSSDGKIYVKGKLIERDKELVDGMREFLKLVT